MELIQLTRDYDLKPFDCGDSDLNGFLLTDAKTFLEKRLGKTFLLVDDEEIVAYCCLFNDKISKLEMNNGAWRKIKKVFPHRKHFSSYPAVKIGRFAVSKDYKGKGLGSEFMTTIKYILDREDNHSTFRYLTVDAYLSAIPFYEKNDFQMLLVEDSDRHTRMMYFDMMRL